ncbi:hypothetical protein NDU88_005393 [Pleurodeles waltl]|uniref:Helicase ATP-binding domain-containing protein n=1 Tax=Pleurodeles waltl TaxID=8319 RepID=A0AAV7PF98_PLEWA|nr:hypothetical protein NDU88_005393 [Pleurodeles waltl]
MYSVTPREQQAAREAQETYVKMERVADEGGFDLMERKKLWKNVRMMMSSKDLSMTENNVNNELLDYKEDQEENQAGADTAEVPTKKEVKDSYLSIHSSCFRDFLMKPKLLCAIVNFGLEHPSEVQHEYQQGAQTILKVHAHSEGPKWFFGRLSIKKDENILKKNCPHIVVGTRGCILGLARNKILNLKHIKHFILDECDKMLEQLDMCRDIQEIFCMTPHEKQVMMFIATLSKEIRPSLCKIPLKSLWITRPS